MQNAPRYRETELRAQLRLAHSLRTAPRLEPSLESAQSIQRLLTQVRSHCAAEPEVVAQCNDALASIAVYIREACRESWRKPAPADFHAAAEKAVVVSNLVGPRAVAKLKEPPPSHENFEAIIEARHEALNHRRQMHDNPCYWRDCYRGTILLRHSDVAAAVVIRSVEKALKEAKLDDAYVTAENDLVAAYWMADKQEGWEKDLLLFTLEAAAVAAGLPATKARVRWRRSREWAMADDAGGAQDTVTRRLTTAP